MGLTADICDLSPPHLQVLSLSLTHYGGTREFEGIIRTARVFEDNTVVRALLEQPGQGCVLVVDGGGSQRCALMGDRLAEVAFLNSWTGVIVYGAVRDSAELAAANLGILALGTSPLRSRKRGDGECDACCTFGSITFRPGEYLYADTDGVVVTRQEIPGRSHG